MNARASSLAIIGAVGCISLLAAWWALAALGMSIPSALFGGLLAAAVVLGAWQWDEFGPSVIEALGGTSPVGCQVLPELRKVRWPALILVGVLLFVFTWNSPPGGAAAKHYIGLLAVCLGVTRLVVEQFGRRRRPAVFWSGLAATFLLLVFFAHGETYTVRWTDGDDVSHVDTHRRWGNGLEYRHSVAAQEAGFSWREGPMLADKRHGRWERHFVYPPKVEYQWYWQGEPVTEEQWSRRDRGP